MLDCGYCTTTCNTEVGLRNNGAVIPITEYSILRKMYLMLLVWEKRNKYICWTADTIQLLLATLQYFTILQKIVALYGLNKKKIEDNAGFWILNQNWVVQFQDLEKLRIQNSCLFAPLKVLEKITLGYIFVLLFNSSRQNSRRHKHSMRVGISVLSSSMMQIFGMNLWMRSIRVVRASDSQCRSRNCPRFYPSILWGAADKTVLNSV